MATNYTFAQAVKIMHKGADKEAIIEITRRFPQMALMVNTMLVKAGEDFVEMASVFPAWMTANKFNGLLKKAAEDTVEDGDEESDDNSEETTEETTKTEEKPARRRRKAVKEEVKESEEETDEDTDSDDPYAGKSAMELFKECKKRKIKAEPKKPAKFYADLLKKDDAAKAKTEDTEDDDWGDGDDDVAEEKKETKKATKKTAKAAKKEEDDDEDWDI